MPRFTMWYSKTIDAPDLNQAIRKEKKIPLKFDSIVQDNKVDQQHESCIGFCVSTEDDYDDEE